MKTQIICPVDFSDAANNAVEYAAKLAKVIDAEMTLVNVLRFFSMLELTSVSDDFGGNVRKKAHDNSEKLKLIAEETSRAFNVRVDYDMEVSTKSFANVISSFSQKNILIVMGSNGADEMSQFFFGTNTYDVIKKVECPVLLVPEGAVFSGFNHVLYPLTYKEKGKLALFQFYEFIKKFKTRITFLHISKSDTLVSRELFKAEREDVEDYFGGTAFLYFERIISDEVDERINEFVFENSIDLIVIATRKRSLLETVFGKSPLLSGLTAIAPCPILVFHA